MDEIKGSPVIALPVKQAGCPCAYRQMDMTTLWKATDEISKRRLRWHGRRGLLELDLLLKPFLNEKLDQLDEATLLALQDLLLLPDLTLLDLCNGKVCVDDIRLQKILVLIREA